MFSVEGQLVLTDLQIFLNWTSFSKKTFPWLSHQTSKIILPADQFVWCLAIEWIPDLNQSEVLVLQFEKSKCL